MSGTESSGTAAGAVLMEVRGLWVRYQRGRQTVEAVKGVDFEVRRGECLGIVGESGSGKSSLGRAVLGMEAEAASGNVEYGGLDVLRMGRAERREFRRKAQMVFQDPLGSLNPRMKIGAALGEVLRVHGLARGREEVARRVAEWLETVELGEEYADRFPHELSGGQRQRVNLARSLCTGAEFLVADEPVSALDVSVQARILKLLKDLQRTRGITLLFIGHDLAVMKHMADRVLVMNCGEIVERGAAADVLGNPRHEYTRELLAAVPRV